MVRLLQETPNDWHEVENLYDTCFAPGREALSSYRLRIGAPVRELCYVLRDDYDVVGGAIRYWPIDVGGTPALLLGPIAVHPTRQGEGLAGILMHHTLDLARHLNWDWVVLVGDEPYYRKFGFAREYAQGIVFPEPTNAARVLALQLRERPVLKGPILPVATEVHHG